MRGNPDNLRQAAARKSAAAHAPSRARTARDDPHRTSRSPSAAWPRPPASRSDFLYRYTADPPTRRTPPRPTADTRRHRRRPRPGPGRTRAASSAPSPPSSPSCDAVTATRSTLSSTRSKPPTARTSNYAAASATDTRHGHRDTLTASLADALRKRSTCENTAVFKIITPDNQALDRTQPSLPMSPDAAKKRTHDYVRHGTTNLFAALNVADGTVISCLHRRHRYHRVPQVPAKIDPKSPPTWTCT